MARKCPRCASENHEAVDACFRRCAACGHVFQEQVRQRSLVAQLPGYAIDDNAMPERFRAELRTVQSIEALDAFLAKWRAVWQLEQGYLNATILAGTFDKEAALQCIQASFDRGCTHLEKASCIGMDIALPPAFLRASLIAAKFGVPFCTALHQLYCTDETHTQCF